MRLLQSITILKTKYVALLSLCVLISFPIQSQNPTDKLMTREIGIHVDNDQPFETDKYYTAGQDFYYRWLTLAKFPFVKNTDSTKTIFTFHYGNKVFNPLNLDTKDTQYMDRPYCGWNFIGMELQNFNRRNSGNLLAVQVGLVGPASGMGAIQVWWHQAINLYPVQGWDSQIVNEVVVNFNYNHSHAFTLGKGIEMVSNSGAWMGTGSNKLTQDFTLRLFKFNPLSESSFLSSRISGKRNPEREFFFFASVGGDLVFSNIFIQGSLFASNPSPFTTTINPLYISTRVGIQYSSKRISASFSLAHLTQETEWVKVHDYASVSMAFRY